MSETDSTQLWNDEDDDLQGGQSFSDALASLEEHLQDQKDENPLEDESQAYAEAYEEGVNFEPAIDEEGDPEAVSFADFSEEDGLPDHGTQPEEDAGVSIGDELESALAAGPAYDEVVDVPADLDAELDDAVADDMVEATLDDGVGGASDDYADDTYTEVEDEDFLAAEDAADEAGDYGAYPSYEESEAGDDYDAAPVADVEEAPAAESPMAGMLGGHDATDDFNLATLTQLVDEIRQESERVSDMKSSVARALSLIQEMSESLKS